MRSLTKTLTGKLLLLSIFINGVIFFFKDTFLYEKYSSVSELYQPCKKNCQQKWRSFLQDTPENELNSAKIISDSFIQPGKSTIEKVVAIGSFLRRQFQPNSGGAVNLSMKTPFEKFKAFCINQQTSPDCGDYSEMFALFAWSQNIVCRLVHLSNNHNDHVIAESFIPELNQWVLTDLVNNIIVVQNSTGSYMNMQTFRTEFAKGLDLTALQFSADTLIRNRTNNKNQVVAGLYPVNVPVFYYYRTNLNEVYKPMEKLKRYVFPFTWYEVYAPGKTAILAYIKFFFLYTFPVLLFLYWYRRK